MRRRWKIALGILAGLLIVLILNAIALGGQTKDAKMNTEGGQIVDTFAGKVQVTDSGAREKPPIVLLHCYTCSLKWWDVILPILEQDHRVIRVDLLGHGGSAKPSNGYSIENQAAAVASAMNSLQTGPAAVVGHSLGFTVATALAESSPELVTGLVDIDQAPDDSFGEVPFTAKLIGAPLIGPALYRTTPDFEIRDSLKVAFAPGYNLAAGFEDPDQVVIDVRAMTYGSFNDAVEAEGDYTDEKPLDERLAALPTPIPLLVIFGSEDQLYDPAQEAADAFKDVPGAIVSLVEDAGHSPNVEKPMETAALILEFAANAGDEAESPVAPATLPAEPGEPAESPKQGKGKNKKGAKQD